LGRIPTWANREALEFATPTAQKIKWCHKSRDTWSSIMWPARCCSRSA
jgi:hypothetical protein